MILGAPLVLDRHPEVLAWLVVVVGYTAFRTARPIPAGPALRTLVEVVLEAGLMAIGVVTTGDWDSPIVFSVLTAVAVAGFLLGFGPALRLAAASALAIGLPALVTATSGDVAAEARDTGRWAVELVLVALVAGYARRISGEAETRHSAAMTRLGRLTDANTLLFSLHQVAQDLPASLDLGEVLDSTVARLRELLSFDTVAILLREESDGSWSIARRHGARLPNELRPDDLPEPIVQAAGSTEVVHVRDLLRAGGPGMTAHAGSGLYAPLTARGSLVGVLSVEHDDADHFDDRDAALLAGFAEPAALAIDNARWFARLRTVGADEERTRIARDLHDRIGQSLAYLAFELDRIVKQEALGRPVHDDLDGLRDDVRGVIREVRETLHDLRTDVSDEKSISDVLQEFLDRVQARSGVTVSLRIDEPVRLPRPQERELWRIVQEGVVNAERHAAAHRIEVTWVADGRSAEVVVADDGRGFTVGQTGRLDSYGLIGMRERAASIGATLDIDSHPGGGTRIHVRLRPV